MNTKRILFRVSVAPFMALGYLSAWAYISWRIGFIRGKFRMDEFARWVKKS